MIQWFVFRCDGVQVCPGQEEGEEAQAAQVLSQQNPYQGLIPKIILQSKKAFNFF